MRDPRQTTYRRFIGGIALIVAPFFNWMAALFNPIGPEMDAAAQLDDVAGHAGRAIASAMLDITAAVFFIPAMLAVLHLVAPRALKLGHIAAALSLAGIIGFTGIAALGLVQAEMVAEGADREQMVALYERLEESAGVALLGALFLICLILGVFLNAIAFLKTRVVPVWVPVLMFGFLVWDVGLGISGVEPRIAGIIDPHMLMFIGLGTVGVMVLRESDADWEASEPLRPLAVESS